MLITKKKSSLAKNDEKKREREREREEKAKR